MSDKWKFALGALLIGGVLAALVGSGYMVGHSKGASAAKEAAAATIKNLTTMVNTERLARKEKSEAVVELTAKLVAATEARQEVKTHTVTKIITEYVKVPGANEPCLDIEAVDAINKIINLQQDYGE